MKTFTKEMQDQITPEQAVTLLKEGNKRFTDNSAVKRDLLTQAQQTSEGQYPFAVVLSCIDSRTSAELIFDQGLGDIFSVRIAGNVVNEDIIGSMEFACNVAGAKLIVVLGHSKCGAVKGACAQVKLGNLTTLLDKISPVVDAEQSGSQDPNSPEFVEQVAAANVKNSVQTILDQSPILKGMIEKGELAIVGAMHDISTGGVKFYE